MVELEFRDVSFCGGRNSWEHVEKPSEQARTHIWSWARIKPEPHIGGRWTLLPWPRKEVHFFHKFEMLPSNIPLLNGRNSIHESWLLSFNFSGEMQCIIIKATIQFGLIKIMETEPEVLFWQSLRILSLQPMNKSKVPWISFIMTAYLRHSCIWHSDSMKRRKAETSSI